MLIFFHQIKVYEKYNGYEDIFVRCATGQEKNILSPQNFILLNKLIQDAYLVEKGLASQKFTEQMLLELEGNCVDEKTVNYIKQIAASFFKTSE